VKKTPKHVKKQSKSINYTEISVQLDKKKPCTNAGLVVYNERGDAVVRVRLILM
jgi:hypothetical protein